MDMFMVARRGRVSGTNHASVLASRVKEVANYHEHRETLQPSTFRDVHRYCAEFHKLEAESYGPEYSELS